MGCNTSTDGQDNTKHSDDNISQNDKIRLENVASKTPIRNIYKFLKVLGSGGFGIVKLAHMRAQKDKKVAIKIIEKKKLKKRQYLLLRELEVLQQLDHPNIIKFYEVYQDAMWFYIVMEYCEGGELILSITEKKYFKEKEAARVMHKLISAVNHIHSKGIVHRDLKPENIKDIDSEIKIIDFGLSTKYDINTLHTMVGTPLYVAPEILNGTDYGNACDLWSLGVILYILLTGTPPFIGHNRQEIFYKIQNAVYSINTSDWQRVTASAKDLVLKLMEKDTNKRLNSSLALKHPWFQQSDRRISKIENTDMVDPKIINLLKTYKTTSRFKTEVVKVFINHLNDKDIQDLKHAFLVIDKDNTGTISQKELTNVIKNTGIQLNDEEITTIIKNISLDNEDGQEPQIKYSEFIAATIDQQMYLSKEKLWSLFTFFDQSRSNFITLNDLKDIFERNGQAKTQEEIKAMIQEVDPNSDGKISFEEFEILMKGENIPQELDEEKIMDIKVQ